MGENGPNFVKGNWLGGRGSDKKWTFLGQTAWHLSSYCKILMHGLKGCCFTLRVSSFQPNTINTPSPAHESSFVLDQ
jgi:hypothetical protein